MKRVVVTGMGLITPIGNSVEDFWKGIHEKKVGIDFIQNFDTTDYKAKVAAEIRDFNPKDFISVKESKRMDRFTQMAVSAALQAFRDSRLVTEQEDKYRLGVCVGSGVGSLEIGRASCRERV